MKTVQVKNRKRHIFREQWDDERIVTRCGRYVKGYMEQMHPIAIDCKHCIGFMSMKELEDRNSIKV